MGGGPGGSGAAGAAPAGTRLVVGVDIGNSTTEACVAEVDGGAVTWLGTGLAATSEVKGTPGNVRGVLAALDAALAAAGRRREEVDLLLVNEATPVISDLAMETITETVITDSTMIGHNPATPGGQGLGVGRTVLLGDLPALPAGEPLVVVVPAGVDFADAAAGVNDALRRDLDVVGAVVRQDDAVLIANRLDRAMPIVDEVTHVERLPLGMSAAVEVAAPGRTISVLSNSYGLATVFGLSPDETRAVAPVARALVGTRSAVVVRTPSGEVTGRAIPAGAVHLQGARRTVVVEVDEGAEAIMQAVGRVQPLEDVVGDAGTNVGGMLATVRDTMGRLTGTPPDEVHIRDVLAVDTFVPQEVRGGLAGEFHLENAVGLAAMVRTAKGPMEQVAAALREHTGVEVVVGGVEADMAVLGALTTPGTDQPLAVLDLGGGSTDAALLPRHGEVRSTHVAGAGDLVTRLIASELGLADLAVAEEVKKHPLAKVESLFHVRMEDASVRFYDAPLPPEVFARVVVLSDEGMVPVPTRAGMEEIRRVRREAKRRVFVVNALRALAAVAPSGSLRALDFVVLLGGSALDFEISDMIAAATAEHGITCGTGNVRATEGPRNAVATGLVAAHASVGAERAPAAAVG